MKQACQHCRQPYEALTAKSFYCSGRCRAEASRQKRARAVAEALDQAELALEKARTALGKERKR